MVVFKQTQTRMIAVSRIHARLSELQFWSHTKKETNRIKTSWSKVGFHCTGCLIPMITISHTKCWKTTITSAIGKGLSNNYLEGGGVGKPEGGHRGNHN